MRRTLHKGRVVDFGLEDVVLPNGASVTLEIIRHPGAAAVLPLHEDGTVTLILQHRHAVGGRIVEVPAGVLEPGEGPEACARRELAEEVQLAAGNLESLGVVHTTPGFTDEVIHLFLATSVTPTAGRPEADEVIEAMRLPAHQAWAMVRDGAITDGKTIAALARAAARLGWGR